MAFESGVSWGLIVQVGQFAITGGIAVYLYIEKKNDKTNERVDEVEKKQTEHAAAIAVLRSQEAGAITHADLGDIHERINLLASSTGVMAGELRALRDQQMLLMSTITKRGLGE